MAPQGRDSEGSVGLSPSASRLDSLGNGGGRECPLDWGLWGRGDLSLHGLTRVVVQPSLFFCAANSGSEKARTTQNRLGRGEGDVPRSLLVRIMIIHAIIIISSLASLIIINTIIRIIARHIMVLITIAISTGLASSSPAAAAY